MKTYRQEKRIIVKDFTKLEKYGFVKQGTRYLYFTGNKGKYQNQVYTIEISEQSRRHSNKKHFVNISSHSVITLWVICEMYKDGVIEIVDSEKNDLQLQIAKKQKQLAKLKDEIEELERRKEFLEQ